MNFENFWPKRGAVGGDARRQKAATKGEKWQKDFFKRPPEIYVDKLWVGDMVAINVGNEMMETWEANRVLCLKSETQKTTHNFKLTDTCDRHLWKQRRRQNVMLIFFAASRQEIGYYWLITFALIFWPWVLRFVLRENMIVVFNLFFYNTENLYRNYFYLILMYQVRYREKSF